MLFVVNLTTKDTRVSIILVLTENDIAFAGRLTLYKISVPA